MDNEIKKLIRLTFQGYLYAATAIVYVVMVFALIFYLTTM